MKRRITVPGHELEFVDEFYWRDEEGQSFTTSCLGSSQNIPAGEQSKQKHSLSIHKVTVWLSVHLKMHDYLGIAAIGKHETQFGVTVNQWQSYNHSGRTWVLPPLQQGPNTFVLDLSHVFEAHLLHSFQRVLAHQPSKRGEGCVLKCSWNIR